MNIKKIFLFGILPLFAVGLFFVNVNDVFAATCGATAISSGNTTRYPMNSAPVSGLCSSGIATTPFFNSLTWGWYCENSSGDHAQYCNAYSSCGDGTVSSSYGEECDTNSGYDFSCNMGSLASLNPGATYTFCCNCKTQVVRAGLCAASFSNANPYTYPYGTVISSVPANSCAYGQPTANVSISPWGTGVFWRCKGSWTESGVTTFLDDAAGSWFDSCAAGTRYYGDGVVQSEYGEQCENVVPSAIGDTSPHGINRDCTVGGYAGAYATCTNGQWDAGSCSTSQYCGDSSCNGPESCSSCPSDCVGSPSVSSVTASCVSNLVSVTVSGSAPVCGFHSTSYSFNGGSTWQASNVYNSGLSSYTQGANTVKIRDSYGNISTAYASAVSQTCVTAPTVPAMSFIKDVGRGKGWVAGLGGIAADGMNVYKYDLANSQRSTVFTQGTAFTAGTSFSNVAVYSLSCPKKYVFEAIAFNTLTGGATCPSTYSLSNKLCSPVRYVTTTIDYCTHHMFGF